MRQTAAYIKRGKSIDPSGSNWIFHLHVMLSSTKYTANIFSRRHFQMCFAGPSMGNSADADQVSPDVALHLGLYC